MAAYWDTEKGEVILCESVDISIAVATDKVIEWESFSVTSL